MNWFMTGLLFSIKKQNNMKRMKYIAKRALMMAAALVCLVSGTLVMAVPAACADYAVQTVLASVENIDIYGDPKLEMTSGELADLGYEYADIVTVHFLDQTIDMPVIPAFRYVGSGCVGLLMWEERSDPLCIAIFNGSFTTEYGLAETQMGSDGKQMYVPGAEYPIVFTIDMKEKNGYADTYALFDLSRTNSRADYPGLSDEEFANFREVTAGGIGAGRLYRSSSPINPQFGRNRYADQAAEKHGIKSVINLEDTEESAREYSGYEGSYYSRQNVLYLNLGVDLTLEYNRANLVKAMERIAEAEASILVHCMEGTDRAGVFVALLECLMGASAEEIRQDYMITFYNYYGLTPGTEQYEQISHGIETNLENVFDAGDFEGLDLQREAEAFFFRSGVDQETLDAVKKKLAGE